MPGNFKRVLPSIKEGETFGKKGKRSLHPSSIWESLASMIAGHARERGIFKRKVRKRKGVSASGKKPSRMIIKQDFDSRRRRGIEKAGAVTYTQGHSRAGGSLSCKEKGKKQNRLKKARKR